MANITVVNSVGTVFNETDVEVAVGRLDPGGGLITFSAGGEWFYNPPLEVAEGTIMVVEGGGLAILTCAQQTAEDLDSSISDAIRAYGNDVHLTGIHSKCESPISGAFAGHAFSVGGRDATVTDCLSTGFSLKGIRLGHNGQDVSGIRWRNCHAESDRGVSGKALTGFQADTGSRQTADIVISDCSVGDLLNGGPEKIAVKLARCDVALVNNLGFDQATQRVVLAEGLGQVRLAGFSGDTGPSDWLQSAPDEGFPEIADPLEFIIQAAEQSELDASGGSAILIEDVDQTFFSDPDGASVIFVRCTTGSALIRIPGLHVEGEYVTIPAGTTLKFRLNHMGIKTVIGRSGVFASSLIDFGVLFKTVAI